MEVKTPPKNFPDSDTLPVLVIPDSLIESQLASNYSQKCNKLQQISLSFQEELNKGDSTSVTLHESELIDNSSVSAFSSGSSSCSSSTSSSKSTRHDDDSSADADSAKEAIQRLQESINDDEEEEEIYISTTSLPDISLYAKDSISLRSSVRTSSYVHYFLTLLILILKYFDLAAFLNNFRLRGTHHDDLDCVLVIIRRVIRRKVRLYQSFSNATKVF